jgi:hypothetical protein
MKATLDNMVFTLKVSAWIISGVNPLSSLMTLYDVGLTVPWRTF